MKMVFGKAENPHHSIATMKTFQMHYLLFSKLKMLKHYVISDEEWEVMCNI